VLLKKEGRVDEAIESYSKAIELQPDCAEAYSNLGVLLIEQGRVDEAIESFRKAIELQPDCAKAYFN